MPGTLSYSGWWGYSESREGTAFGGVTQIADFHLTLLVFSLSLAIPGVLESRSYLINDFWGEACGLPRGAVWGWDGTPGRSKALSTDVNKHCFLSSPLPSMAVEPPVLALYGLCLKNWRIHCQRSARSLLPSARIGTTPSQAFCMPNSGCNRSCTLPFSLL